MTLTFLGTGTSQGIPVIACKCATCTSNDPRDKRLRSSVLIEVGDKKILIDTSPDLRQQMLSNAVDMVDAILFTHEHNDHTAGLDDIRPFNFLAKKAMPLFGEESVLQDLKRRFAYAFGEKKYPGAPVLTLNNIAPFEPFVFENIEITPLRIIHGDLPILGFKIGSMAYLTDVKAIDDTSLSLLQDIDTLVISALRSTPHHSHISLSESIEISQNLNAKNTYLIHMSHDLGPTNTWEVLLPKNVYPAYDGLTINSSLVL